MTLREEILKLAHTHPEMRQHLIPLLRRTASDLDSLGLGPDPDEGRIHLYQVLAEHPEYGQKMFFFWAFNESDAQAMIPEGQGDVRVRGWKPIRVMKKITTIDTRGKILEDLFTSLKKAILQVDPRLSISYNPNRQPVVSDRNGPLLSFRVSLGADGVMSYPLMYVEVAPFGNEGEYQTQIHDEQRSKKLYEYKGSLSPVSAVAQDQALRLTRQMVQQFQREFGDR